MYFRPNDENRRPLCLPLRPLVYAVFASCAAEVEKGMGNAGVPLVSMLAHWQVGMAYACLVALGMRAPKRFAAGTMRHQATGQSQGLMV